MTPRCIAVIDGHPDPDPARFCHALTVAYAEGSAQAGHAVERITLAGLDIPLLRSRADWEAGPPPPAVRPAQERWAAPGIS
jgi:putative NADPH-quinone reductase